jgi:hypothetical protein
VAVALAASAFRDRAREVECNEMKVVDLTIVA